jgi:hypothetical protein
MRDYDNIVGLDGGALLFGCFSNHFANIIAGFD